MTALLSALCCCAGPVLCSNCQFCNVGIGSYTGHISNCIFNHDGFSVLVIEDATVELSRPSEFTCIWDQTNIVGTALFINNDGKEFPIDNLNEFIGMRIRCVLAGDPEGDPDVDVYHCRVFGLLSFPPGREWCYVNPNGPCPEGSYQNILLPAGPCAPHPASNPTQVPGSVFVT